MSHFPLLSRLSLIFGLVAGLSAAARPNILIIMVDDMGYSDLGCFGGEIRTPHLDRLAANGLKFSAMYNTGKCYPTRASLLTGVYFQRTDTNFSHTATLGEVVRPAGYHTWWSGKHHAKFNPVTRGFDRYYGLLGGAQNHFNPGDGPAPGQPAPARKGDANRWSLDVAGAPDLTNFIPQDPKYYDTDAFTDRALGWLDEYQHSDKPFLLYLAYTAPHWPLQAWPEDIAKYKGVYDAGYEPVRQARYQRQVQLGLIDPKTSPLPPLESGRKAAKWEELSTEERRKEAHSMEIYAAMVDRVDQNIGRLLKRLEAQGKLENTLILFLSDNGACAEVPKVAYVDPAAPMGTVASYVSYGPNWASVGNTPLRKWKSTSHEGGIATPLVVHWPAGIKPRSDWNHEPVHLIDIMPTVAAVAGANYPGASPETAISRPDGVSLLPAFKGEAVVRNQPLFFQFNKGSAVRDGPWKLVRLGPTWELYHLASDRTETHDLAAKRPELVKQMDAVWRAWWKDCTGQDWTGTAPKEKENE
ncbi:MAG: arylsulfatase [Opitutaceae bacterium]|nr:arylsulfatase [Opitutaceae bacterium]